MEIYEELLTWNLPTKLHYSLLTLPPIIRTYQKRGHKWYGVQDIRHCLKKVENEMVQDKTIE